MKNEAIAAALGKILLAASCATAPTAAFASCARHTTGEGFEGADDEAGGSSGNGGGNDAGGGGATATMPTAPSAAYDDGGIPCGTQGACASSGTCCYPSASGNVPSAPTCTAQGSCNGSSLACSSTQHCAGSQVCCFAYDTSGAADAEPAVDAGFGFAFAAAPMAFTAQCADQCPGGDMIHYQLCASASDCPDGQACVPGTYTPYCAAGLGAGFANPFGAGGAAPGDDGG